MDATQSFTRRGFSTRITTADERMQDVRLVSRLTRITLESRRDWPYFSH